MKQSKFIYQDNEKFALRVVGIEKNYGKNKVLKGIDLEVKKGERIALLGRNGSGKSTFISLITQQRAFREGTVVYGYADTKSKALELLGVQFQNLSYPEGFFVKDVLKLFQSAVPLGIRLTKQQLDDLIDLFGIKPYLKQRIDKLSGGQQQRVNIILSLIKRPKLLILDEISSGLDVKSSTDIKNYIKKYLELDKEVSLIIVSHNIEEVIELTKTSYVLKDGLISEVFPSKNLTLEKFMDIVSIDIDLVAKNVKQAKKNSIVENVNNEYIDIKNKYIDDIKKRHEKFIYNLDFQQVYRLQDELVELNSLEFKEKLAIKIAQKTTVNKEQDQKEINQKAKEIKKDPLHKKILSNESKLLELNSKEFKDELYAKLELKQKKEQVDLEKKLDKTKKDLEKYIKENSINSLNNTINELEQKLANLNNQKNNNLESKAKKDDGDLIINKKNESIVIDNEVVQIKSDIQKINLTKEEVSIHIAKKTDELNYEQKNLDEQLNVVQKKDKKEIKELINNNISKIINELKSQKNILKKDQDDFEVSKKDFIKKYQDRIIEDEKLVKVIIQKETDLRKDELYLLEKTLTEEQDSIASKRHEYDLELKQLKKQIPTKIKELEQIAKEKKEKSDAKIIAHDKSYENSWTNYVYDYLDKGKKKFNITPPKKGNIVEIRYLFKSFKKIRAVRNFNLDIKDGDRIAITGPNGSGKSTIVSMLGQLVKPDCGEIAYSFGKTKRSVINNVGIQFQNSSFPQEMSVFDVVIFFARANRYSLTKNEIHDALKVFKLDNLQKNKAYLLSGGEKQRLNVLLALIKKPKLVILDEISTGLDIDSIHKINGYVKEYLDKTKATLIIVSHNYEEIHNLANKLVILNYGIKTEENDIHNWTQEQVKEKMFKIFSDDKNENTNVSDDNLNYKAIHLLESELGELKTSEFKENLTEKILKNTAKNTKEEVKEFQFEEKELKKNPLYKRIESNEAKLTELKSEPFDEILYAKLEPKHKKDLENLEKDLKEKKNFLENYTKEHPIDALNNIINDLEEELKKLSPQSNNVKENLTTEESSEVTSNSNEEAKEEPKLTINNSEESSKINDDINQINVDIKKVNDIKEEILLDIKKQTEKINLDEKELENRINAIIKKDKEEVATLVKDHILSLTNELKHQKQAILTLEQKFVITKEEFEKKQAAWIKKDKELVETIIKEETSLRTKQLSSLENVITDGQEEAADIKKIPKLNKSISLRIKEINEIEKEKQQKEAEIAKEVKEKE